MKEIKEDTRKTKQKLISKEVEEIVDNLTLFDDDLMSRCFDHNVPATEYLLQTILGRKVKVLSVRGQSELKNPIVGGRNIRLDIEAKEENGDKFNVEVQRSTAGAHVRRARFHSSMIDARMLRRNQKFKELKDSYVIFITQNDIFKKGKSVYNIERIIRETEEDFTDGSHIIYINGQSEEDSEIGRLIHDFKCKKASEIFNDILAKSVSHFKEGEGRKEMCEAVENYGIKREQIGRREGREKGREEGREEGIQIGEIKATIQTAIRYGATKETIIEDLLSRFEYLSREDATKLYDEYSES